ncbi:MAG TPA: hypothetical protein VLY03_07215 [Bacteroidota bacterium]|nr:hypothetical protein [Bacteroidota bacterium]
MTIQDFPLNAGKMVHTKEPKHVIPNFLVVTYINIKTNIIIKYTPDILIKHGNIRMSNSNPSLVLGIALFSFIAIAPGQTYHHGTCIVVKASKHKIVVSADGKVNNTGTTKTFTIDKIQREGNIFFCFSGLYDSSNGVYNVYRYAKIACKKFASVKEATNEFIRISCKEMTTQIRYIRRYRPDVYDSLQSHYIVDGVFFAHEQGITSIMGVVFTIEGDSAIPRIFCDFVKEKWTQESAKPFILGVSAGENSSNILNNPSLWKDGDEDGAIRFIQIMCLTFPDDISEPITTVVIDSKGIRKERTTTKTVKINY